MTNDDPPLLRLSLLAGLILFMGISTYQPVEFETFTEPTTSVSVEAIPNDQLVIINGNSILGLGSPTSNEEVLASLTPLEKDIIFCESSNIPTKVNPISKATGLFQVIPKSEKFCERGLGRELNMKDPIDNIDCAHYLMKHGGLTHWSESRHCWDK